MKSNKNRYILALCLFLAFVLWTLAVEFIDVRPIGPEGSAVGLAAVNGAFNSWTGFHPALYELTDKVELLALAIVFAFAVLGLIQWIQRKSLKKVDIDIIALGGFYLLVLASYALFEILKVNFRPVLIDGILEASYPSSTTLLICTVMPIAHMQFSKRLPYGTLKRIVLPSIYVYSALMEIARTVCGVHWLSDIIGAMLLGHALNTLYGAVVRSLRPTW